MRSEAQTRELAPRGNGARAWPRTHSVWESRRSDGGSEPLCMSSRNESTEGGGAATSRAARGPHHFTAPRQPRPVPFPPDRIHRVPNFVLRLHSKRNGKATDQWLKRSTRLAVGGRRPRRRGGRSSIPRSSGPPIKILTSRFPSRSSSSSTSAGSSCPATPEDPGRIKTITGLWLPVCH